jgi:hypothetical protein
LLSGEKQWMLLSLMTKIFALKFILLASQGIKLKLEESAFCRVVKFEAALFLLSFLCICIFTSCYFVYFRCTLANVREIRTIYHMWLWPMHWKNILKQNLKKI